MKKLNKKHIQDILFLTPMQQGILFHYLREPEVQYYFNQLSLAVSGDIDAAIFTKAWQFVIKNNEMLRTLFRWEKLKQPVQIILKQYHPQIAYHDLSNLEENQKEKQLEKIKKKDKQNKFDLHEFPFRITLGKIKDRKYEIIITHHHILYDGWSTGIILKEFFAAYNDLSGKRKLITPAKTTYKEFIKEIQKKNPNKQKKFWQSYLRGFDAPGDISIKKPKKKSTKTTAVANIHVKLARSTSYKLKSRAKINKITIPALIYSAWGILLQKYNNSNDVLLGTTVSGRNVKVKGIEDIVGLFINTLPLRVQTHAHEKVMDLLANTNNALHIREEFENTPLTDIKEYSDVDNQEELFDSIVVIENYPLDRELTGKNRKLSVTSYSIFQGTHYDLTVCIFLGEDIAINFIYQRERFEREAIKRLSSHFLNLVEEIIEKPGEKISTVEILSEEEKKQVLIHFNDTIKEYPRDKTIQQLFAEQVERTPEHTALVGVHETHEKHKKKCNMSYMSHMSYKELNHKSNQLALLLKEKGVKPDTIAAIMLERSLEMIIGILAILKAGGGYLPLDPDYPQERINYMLKDSNAGVLVTTPKLQFKVKAEVEEVSGQPGGLPLQIINVEKLSSPSTLTSTSTCQVGSANLAYIIYTSGTTGKPKGVMISHQSLVNLCYWHNNEFNVTGSDHAALYANFSFDASVWELFPYIIKGATLHIIREPVMDIENLNKYYHRHIITIGFLPPQVFQQFIRLENRSLRILLTGSDKLNTFIKTRYQSVNNYGPTENTVITTSFFIDKNYNNIPIGKPIGNTKVYIIDRHLSFSAIGVPGELCIGGDGLARGYLNSPDLTAEKFLPFSYTSYTSYRTYISKKIYKTGDLARWLGDGNIEFLGRIDHQVKIRGFRIELGEIEHHLLNHDHIKEAVVIIKSDNTGDKYLCAYVVPAGNVVLTTLQLKKFLSPKLPAYMIPTYFTTLEAIPLTPNGKVNRKALPEPNIKAGKNYTAPRNKLEEKLADLWSEVLSMDRDPLQATQIGIEDNFFDLGGHSLKAAALITKIHRELDVKLSLAEIFETPNIKALAESIKKLTTDKYQSIKPTEEKEYYSLSPTHKKFYIEQQKDLESTVYNMTLFLTIKGELETNNLLKAFRKLIQRHESLRTSFEMIKDEPVQRIHEKVEFKIEYYSSGRQGERETGNILESSGRQGDRETGNILESSGRQGERETGNLWENSPKTPLSLSPSLPELIKPFNLSQAPLLRVGLLPAPCSLPPASFILMIDMHHIISDLLSHQTLVKDFTAFYHGSRLPPLTLQYKDFSQWQTGKKQIEKIKKQEAFWLKVFEKEKPGSYLPTDYDYPASIIPGNEGDMVKFQIGPQATRELKALALEQGTTMYMMIFAIYNVFLFKLSGSEDIIIATMAAGRRHADLEKIIGAFVNTLVMRNYPQPQKTFREFLKEVKEQSLQALENQDYQIDNLVANVPWLRNLNQVGFTFESSEIPPIKLANLDIEPFPYKNQTTKVDLALGGNPGNNHLGLFFEYRTKLFKKETIKRFTAYLKNIVSCLLKNIDIKISHISLLSEQEKERLISTFNNNRISFPEDKPIWRLFARQAGKTPDHIAIKSEHMVITYRQLNERVNQWARLLRQKGIQQDALVGILLKRSILMVESILAVWKAGGAYIPLEVQDPGQRLMGILNDSQAALLITQTQYVNPDIQSTARGKILSLDTLEASTGKNNPGNPVWDLDIRYHIKGLAYVIYTSGSTGKPKGAMVEHLGMMNHIAAKVHDLQLSSSSIIAQNSPHIFDISVWQFFAALTVGGKTIIYPEEVVLEPLHFFSRLAADTVTHLEVVPSYLSVLLSSLKEKQPARLFLEFLLVTGETLKPQLVKQWFEQYPGIKMVNAYGPTEASDDITHHVMDKAPAAMRIPIGQPIGNLTITIVDENMNLCPIGVKGELCVSGIGVGRGYLNQPQLTKENFCLRRPGGRFLKKLPPWTPRKNFLLNKSFCGGPGGGFLEKSPLVAEGKIYKTGDLARWLSDGTIEFFGRKDYQVKIRGFRIELEEIENLLNKHPLVKNCVIVVKEDQPGNKYLCAYIVGVPGSEPVSSSHIKAYLSGYLPEYMVPAYFVILERLPLTVTGKIDRHALPEPGLHSRTITYISEEMLNNLKLFENKKSPPLPQEYLKSNITRIHTIFERENIIIQEYSRQHKKKYYPLSHSQKMIYNTEKIFPGTSCEVNAATLRYQVEIDLELLVQAINTVIRNNETLRLRIIEIETETGIIPAQYIAEYEAIHFDYLDFSGEENEEKLDQWINKNTPIPLAFIDSHLFYFVMLKFNKNELGYYVKLHHLVADGWTFLLLENEINQTYQQLKTTGKAANQAKPSYIQYIYDEQEYLKSTRAEESRKFWHQTIFPFPGEWSLTTKVNDSENIETNTLELSFPGELSQNMVEYCKSNRSTPYRLIFSALAIYIAKVTACHDFFIGSVSHGRSSKYKETRGVFINFIPIRVNVDETMDFQSFLKKECTPAQFRSLRHHRYPFDILASEIREYTGRDMRYLWDINLVEHPPFVKENRRNQRFYTGFDPTPLTIHINPLVKESVFLIQLAWIYQVESFYENDIKQLHNGLTNILTQALARPGTKLAQIQILTDKQKEHIIYRLNQGEVTLPDQQVWIKGIRIATGKIENILQKHHDIKEVLIAAKYNNTGEKYLCAYVTSEKNLAESQLREYLDSQLPHYMVPAEFIQLEKMPLTSNGKINRSLLEALEIQPTDLAYEAPRDEMERQLVDILSGALGLDEKKIGIGHNLFELGGNSLNLLMAVSKINKTLKTEMPVTYILKNPTIKEISKCIKSRKFVEEPVVLLNQLTPRKIFCFPPQTGYGFVYMNLAAEIKDYTFYAFSFIESDNRLKEYVDIITGLQTSGPYILFGYSAAAGLTFEVAKELEKHGHQVADIILWDSFYIDKESVEINDEYMKGIYRAIAEFLEQWGLSFLKKNAVEKTQHYIRYLLNINNLEPVHARVHLIYSEESRQEKRDTGCWNRFSTKESKAYRGFGDHLGMFARGNVEHNAQIMKQVLEKIP